MDIVLFSLMRQIASLDLKCSLMCIIIDANKIGELLDVDNEDMEPVRVWLSKFGKIVYSVSGKSKEEREQYQSFPHKFREYSRANKLIRVSPSDVEKEIKNLPKLKSDDPHIVALAKLKNVKVLVSGDKKLHKDFKKIAGGGVYQKKEHEHLLTPDLCKSSTLRG